MYATKCESKNNDRRSGSGSTECEVNVDVDCDVQKLKNRIFFLGALIAL